MIMKGSKIKLKEKLPGMDDRFSVGDVFEITNIDGGTISFQCFYGAGFMSLAEMNRYFEEVKNREWTEWEIDERLSDYWFSDVYFRTNGKKVEVEILSEDVKGWSSCSPEDDFDLDAGKDIAFARALLKVYGAKR